MIIGIDASRAVRAKRTGTERYALEMIRHLLALPAATHYRWHLYVDEPVPPSCFGISAAGPPSVEEVLLPRQRLWTHRALAREIRQRPPDLLFVPAHVIPFLPARLWRREAAPATVVTVHDLGYHEFPEAHSYLQRLYLPLSTWWSSWVADAVIAVSNATARDLRTHYGTAAAKIAVIHEAGGMETKTGETLSVDGAGAHAPLPPHYGLFVGTLQPRKNLTRLLTAYARLYHRGSVRWPLLLAGAPGHRAAALRAQAHALQIEEQVHFLGYVADEELAALFRGAHLFLFPSLFEGFGLPVLEAQAFGVPVMCANNSSLPEVAGDAALLVDPTDVEALADAMLRLSEDEALRQQLIAAGYENIKRFSWEKAARETMAVFEQVLQRARGGAEAE